MSIINSIKMLIFPRAFARAEVEKAKRHIKEDKNASYGDLDKWYETTLERVRTKRKGKIISLIIVALVATLGFLSAGYINKTFPLSIEYIRYVRLASIIVIGWSVLGRIGYESNTISGMTLLEKTSEDTFKYFYIIGLFIMTIALFLEPLSFSNQIHLTPDGAG